MLYGPLLVLLLHPSIVFFSPLGAGGSLSLFRAFGRLSGGAAAALRSSSSCLRIGTPFYLQCFLGTSRIRGPAVPLLE